MLARYIREGSFSQRMLLEPSFNFRPRGQAPDAPISDIDPSAL
jgi:hypothetical protein